MEWNGMMFLTTTYVEDYVLSAVEWDEYNNGCALCGDPGGFGIDRLSGVFFSLVLRAYLQSRPGATERVCLR
jgi:hypothetical protein